MKKFELNVVSYNNEDVIATSAIYVDFQTLEDKYGGDPMLRVVGSIPAGAQIDFTPGKLGDSYYVDYQALNSDGYLYLGDYSGVGGSFKRKGFNTHSEAYINAKDGWYDVNEEGYYSLVK